jgi:hypothetical protein
MTDTGGVVSYTLGYVRLCLLANPVFFLQTGLVPRALAGFAFAKAGLGKYKPAELASRFRFCAIIRSLFELIRGK